MGFRMILPKRVKKVKSKSAQEVLDRLNGFLESANVVEKPVEFLCRFWKDQQTAITYQELRGAVLAGYIGNEILQQWRQDYSYLVKAQLNDMWVNAMQAGAVKQPVVEAVAGGFTFRTQSPGILSWLDQRGAEFVASCAQQQKDAIAALLSKKMIEGHTVDELSRMIRPCIGLTAGQAKANARYYDSIVESLKKEHPRMKPESIQRKARDAAIKYAERQRRQRAMTIAQTESAFAYNRGADEGIRQAQSQGLIGKVVKRWSTSGDDQVCSVCQGLEGVEVGMDSGFQFQGKLLFAGQDLLPPAHPRCACAVEYIETETSKFESNLPDVETGYTNHGNQLMATNFASEDTPEDKPIIWPEKGEKISREEYKQVMAYAREKGIEMTGFKHFDGNSQTLIDLINDADSVVKYYPSIKEGRKKFTIELSYSMDSRDFAITRGHIVSINGNAYRDIQCLKREYQFLVESGWFVNGTDYHAIIKHEIGHVVANIYGIDGLEIAKKVSGISSNSKLMCFLEDTLSQYAGSYSDGTEIISECFASMYGKECKNEFVLQFLNECFKLI